MLSANRVTFAGSDTARTALYALGGSICLAFCAQICIFLPYAAVAVGLHTFGLFLLVGLMGSRRSFYSVAAYLAEGSVGLPVFSGFGVDPIWFISPKAGYLVSFLIVSIVIGGVIEKAKTNSYVVIPAAFTAGALLVLACGTLWLSFFVGFTKAFWIGAMPYLAGDLLKALSAACIVLGLKFTRKS